MVDITEHPYNKLAQPLKKSWADQVSKLKEKGFKITEYPNIDRKVNK